MLNLRFPQGNVNLFRYSRATNADSGVCTEHTPFYTWHFAHLVLWVYNMHNHNVRLKNCLKKCRLAQLKKLFTTLISGTKQGEIAFLLHGTIFDVQTHRALWTEPKNQGHTTSQFFRIHQGPSWPWCNQQISMFKQFF